MDLVSLAILIYSVILHEIAHGFIAERLGDPTAKVSGRLTLDPRPHIDPLNTILLPALMLFLGSPVVFGAAKPVPVDSFNFKEPKKDMALVALAGPATNIAVAALLSVIYRIIPADFLLSGMVLNVGLAVFNLLPIPPLDGSKVLAGILPDELSEAIYRLESAGFTFIFLALFLFRDLISMFTRPLTRLVLSFLLP